MATPFDTVGSASVSAPDLEALANKANFVGAPKRFFNKAKRNIYAAREGLNTVTDPLLDVRNTISNLPKGEAIPEHLAQELEAKSRLFNNRTSNLGFVEGKLMPSIKGAVKSIGGKLGFDTSNIGSAAMSAGEINGAVIDAFETKANIFERVASKPFRVAANNPKTAIAAIAAGTAYGAYALIRGRAEKRTQREIEAQANAAQAEVIAGQPQRPQPQQSYMNSVSADEAALLAQRQQAAASHVDAAASRASQQPSATGAAL